MPRAALPVRLVPCPTCGAEAGEGCVRADGQTTYAYHRARVQEFKENPVAPPPSADTGDCTAPLIGCWRTGCTKHPRWCEFCGVCADPDCRRRHRP